MEQQALWIVAVIGTGTLIGVFMKMKGGFGPLNLRVVGLVLIAVLAALLAIAKSDNLNAAMGILGAIAGYLFGAKADSDSSSVDASGANLGDNARIAGRDINETVNNINARVQELGKLVSQEQAKIDRLVVSQEARQGPMEYLINTIYERQLDRAAASMNTVLSRWMAEGWSFMGLSSDFQGMDGIFLLFERAAEDGVPCVHVYHGSNMSEVT
jgi:hypothetical protein